MRSAECRLFSSAQLSRYERGAWQDLKRAIIDTCVSPLVPVSVIPFAEAVMSGGLRSVDHNCLAVFSNICGVLRYDAPRLAETFGLLGVRCVEYPTDIAVCDCVYYY